MNSKKMGEKIFKASTHFDWYIIQMANCSGDAKLVDEDGLKQIVNVSSMPFIPGSNISFIGKLLGSPSLDVLYSTAYHNQNDGVSESKSDTFIFPVLHSITMDGPRIMYANSNNKGLFGVRNKVIVSTGESLYSVLDLDGTMGTTEGCFSIVASSKQEAENIQQALISKEFQEKVVKKTKWSNFRIDYKMFKYFRKDFWKDFI